MPSDVRVPSFQTRDILSRDPTAVVSPMIMDHQYAVEYTQTWSGGLQYSSRSSTMAEANYMGSWTVGADNATVHNVPEPGAGPIQARRPIPQLGSIRSIRFDGRSIYHAATFSVVRRLRNNYAYNASYTLSISRDDASNPGPTESEANVPQNVRNIFSDAGEWALSSFDHRHVFAASATYQLPSRAGIAAVLGDWRINGVFLAQSGAPFTVNLGVDQANVGAGPAQRPNQLRDPNLPSGEKTAERWFDTAAFALPAPYTFGSAPRNSVIGTGLQHHRPLAGEDVGYWWQPRARSALGDLQPLQQGELRRAEPHLRHAQFRPHLQREGSARDAVWREIEFLRSAGWRVRHYPVRSGSQRSPSVMIRSSRRLVGHAVRPRPIRRNPRRRPGSGSGSPRARTRGPRRPCASRCGRSR